MMSKNKFLQLLCVFAMAVSLAVPFTACGQTEEGGEKEPCETHTYGEWTESKAPTCAEAGEEVRTCTVCEESETRTIAATGEHAYTWTVTTVATCDKAGVEAGVCGVCGGETTRETAKDKNNHTLWTDWETVSDATCKEMGLRFRVCLDCETEETEEVAINSDAHTFGAYYDTVAATCSAAGSRKHDCALCGTTVTEELAIDPDAHAYETNVENAATCIAEGVAKDVCADCGDTKDGVALPIDIYNHTDTKAWGAETRCDGCGGLLSSMSILDNSAGKCVNSRDLFFDGDFEVVYTFENVCGSDGWWHNWMFDLAPAAYLNGSLIKLDRGTDPLVPIIPWYDGTYYNEYHPYIIKYGGNVETTWFFTQDGVEKDFGESMKGGTDTVATLKRVGDKVTVVSVMTTKGETPATCTITAEAYFPGVQYLCVALTGESNRALISQISVKQGTACPATQAQTGTELLPQSIVIDNSTGKNGQGIDRTYDGDFDLEVDFTMTGDPTNDWHSWIFYVFKGIQSASLGNEETLFWSGTANGAEPEQYALYHDMNHIYYRHDYVGEKAFIPMIADADVTLRIVRTDGYIAIFGIAYSNDEAKTPISNWKYIAGTAYTDTVTVRLTSELSSAEVTSIIEYKGAHNHVTEDVVTKQATCSATGLKDVVCKVCGEVLSEDVEIAINPEAHKYVSSTATEATCITTGMTGSNQCEYCGEGAEPTEIPVNIYNHKNTQAWGGYTRCNDCNGILSEAYELNNQTGKCVNALNFTFDGDFEVVYTFYNACGSDGAWHNWMFDFVPAAYLNGKLTVLNHTNIGLCPVIPWYDGGYYSGNHPYIGAYGGKVETTWFHTASGVEKGFAESMAKGTDTVATVRKVGNALTLTVVMTTREEDPATCTITATLNFPGARYLNVMLSGERNVANISQIAVKSGTLCAATQTVTAEELLDEAIVLNNVPAKDTQGVSYALNGDFDLEYSFVMNSASNSVWHSYVWYIFKGAVAKNEQNLAPGGNIFWAGNGGGYEPEQSGIFHDISNWYREGFVGGAEEINTALMTAKVYMRVTRVNGYLSVSAIAVTNDENESLIANWKYLAGTAYTDTLTVRLTSENSILTLNSIKLYAGEFVHVGNDVVTKEATCSATGLKDVVCKVCGEVLSKDVEIAINPEAHKYVSSTATEATCVTTGMTGSNQCEYCGEGAAPMEIPVDIYNHKNTQAWGNYTRCNDCNGILSEMYTLSNTAGKYTASHETFFDGDFEIVYTFYNACGSDFSWHNWIFDVMPAVYLDGTLEKLERGNDPLAPVIPWYDDGYYGGNHPYIGAYGGKVETTWFHTASGVEKGFAESMAKGTDTVATVRRVGNTVYLTVVMTTREEDPATCTITATLNFAGVQYLCVALTGEGNVAQIEQIQIVSGTACPATKTEEGTQLISEAVTVTNANGAKNVEAKDFTFDGDFDLEVEFVMNGNPGSDWHSWIFLVFKGTQGGALGDANTLFWAGTANGAESEQYALYHGMDFAWYRYDFVSNFAEALATAKITLRITRIDGYLTVFGHAQTNDANSTLISEWKYIAGTQYSDTVTVRLTSENAAFTVNRAELLKGNLYVAHVTEE